MRILTLVSAVALCFCGTLFAQTTSTDLKAGIIGLDTMHVVAFTQSLNIGPKNPEHLAALAGVKVVAAYPQGSKDIPGSVSRVPEYTEKLKEMGVEIVPSIESLLEKVDVVFLESNDGRVHLEQVKPVFQAGKPVFIDKPVAGSLVDCLRIIRESKITGTPWFCTSSLRYGKDSQAVRNGSLGPVYSAETHSPAHLEPNHPELYWYGIHGIESLFTVMGKGVISAQRELTEDGFIKVTGVWADGRTGVFMESNQSDRKGYGGIARGEKGTAPVGSFDGYDVLLVEIVKFFKTRVPPVSTDEIRVIYAFMEAADESKRRGGVPVTVEEVLKKAQKEVRATAE